MKATKLAELERHARAGRYTPAVEVVELIEYARELNAQLQQWMRGAGSGSNDKAMENSTTTKPYSGTYSKT